VTSDMSDAYERAHQPLATTVAARRKQLGLRQQDLADLAGVSHRFVQALEGGKETVRLDKVAATLRALGLHLVAVPDRDARP